MANAEKDERAARKQTNKIAFENLNALDENKNKNAQDLSLLNPLDAVSQSLQNKNKAKASFLERINPNYDPNHSSAVNVMEENLINMPAHVVSEAKSTFSSEPPARQRRTRRGRRARN